MKRLLMKPWRLLVNRLTAIPEDPAKICYGYASGIFLAALPLIGIKLPVALLLVRITGWNKPACLFGLLHVNGLTAPFFFALSFIVGGKVCRLEDSFILPDRFGFHWMKSLFMDGGNAFLALFSGGLLLSIPMTIGAFFLSRSLLNHYKKAGS